VRFAYSGEVDYLNRPPMSPTTRTSSTGQPGARERPGGRMD
jgi:hypothetical protein